ncbi:Concanavalin A-like lectin protein kinase family protein [Euphorbia peplus]|nr:Concanavalin A-like lectin protein kinase family protein [Euphorbia peplus]
MPLTNIFVVFLLIRTIMIASSDGSGVDEFSFNQQLHLDGDAELSSNGLIKLTNDSEFRMGHVFYTNPLQFKNSTGSVFSFSSTFIFAIVHPEYSNLRGHGFSFTISPSKTIPGASSAQYLGLFNRSNDGNSSNHIVAVEMDTFQNMEFEDIDSNHVGIDINSIVSIVSHGAGYFDNQGNFIDLDLSSGENLQVWVEYDGVDNMLNVTIHPISIQKPKQPLLSLVKDLSPYINEFMFVGFSSSNGRLRASHYILGWSFKINGQAQELDLSSLPKIPGVKEENGNIRMLLTIVLSLAGVIIIILLIFGGILISKRRKFIQVLEDWEVLYGPHRFTYKDLYMATKGFKDRNLLGKGGFGRVYQGALPLSNAQIAVKRISHDSRQGIREFIAEIATIGRLRHPNLVRLLGYCRHKNQLFLVYDFMPNGSLDKFLYGQSDMALNWNQRFKIIKDVAAALLYLHQQWVQVIIHRDIKPANVLLDDKMDARLGDFGLAKLCDHGFDPQTTHVAGTLGYIAPELARNGKATTATDIYAFGVFMLEVVCGRRPVDRGASPEEIVLMDWVMDCWDRGEILKTVDSRLENGNIQVQHEAEMVLKLGLLCSHGVAAGRPRVASVVQFLDRVDELPDNLNSIIKSSDFGKGEEEASYPILNISIPSLTLTEAFTSHGR